jgi:hypothetical protein
MIRSARHRLSLIARLRGAGRQCATGAVALFVAVWINMALQPCLMAAEPLLPEQHQESGCPHCPPSTASHCGDADEARCAYVDGFDFDGRSPTDLTSGIELAPVVVQTAALFEFLPDRATISGTHDSGPPPTGPPLFVRHCSFLN